MIRNRYTKTCALLILLGMTTWPIVGCSYANDQDKVARPAVATTNKKGQKDPNVINWAGPDADSESLSEDESTLRDIDMGYFVGASDILNAYYTFDDPINYFTEWPEKGLYMATDSDYQMAIPSFQQAIELIENMDQSTMNEEEIRLIKTMLFDFGIYTHLYKYYLYMPQLNPIGGKQITYPLMTSLIQFRSKDDVERYFKILNDYYEYFSAAADIEQRRSEMGIGWNDEGLDRIIADCSYMADDRENHFLMTTFAERLEALDISEAEKNQYIQRNRELLDTVYFPAMEMLVERLEGLKGMCNDEPYLAYSDEGKEFYENLFHYHTGTMKPVEENIDMLQQEIDRVYETYQPLWQEKGASYSYGSLSFEEARERCESITKQYFPTIRDNKVSVFEIPEIFAESMQPACYMNSPIDNVTKHSVWLNTGMVSDPGYDMLTLVAHEMYPGHLYQHQYQSETLSNKYQVFATGLPYAEGWAEYSEWMVIHYAPVDRDLAEIAWEAKQLYSVFIAARVSIGVEYEGWSYEDSLAYLTKYGQGKEYLDSLWEQITATQCFAVEYAFGFLYTSQIIGHAITELDGICTPEEVYVAYLNLGSAPFDVLEEDMQAFIDEQKG